MPAGIILRSILKPSDIEKRRKTFQGVDKKWKGARLGQQEVEEGPELREVVLQGRPRQQQPPRGREAVQVLGQLALPVLHALRLVNYYVLPVHLRSIQQALSKQ